MDVTLQAHSCRSCSLSDGAFSGVVQIIPSAEDPARLCAHSKQTSRFVNNPALLYSRGDVKGNSQTPRVSFGFETRNQAIPCLSWIQNLPCLLPLLMDIPVIHLRQG